MKGIRTIIILLSMCVTMHVFSQEIQLGIMTDFSDSDKSKTFVSLLHQEIKQVCGNNKSIVLKSNNIYTNIGSMAQAEEVYAQLTDSADLIIINGTNSLWAVQNTDIIIKPTIGVGVVSPKEQNLPLLENGTSGVTNFTYIQFPANLTEELSAFHTVYPFQNVAVFVDEKKYGTARFQFFDTMADSLSKILSSEISIIKSSDILGSIDELPDDVDAVFVDLSFEFSSENIRAIAQKLEEKHIPSFSRGKWSAENGILVSLGADNEPEHVIRKIAIIADDALNGHSLADVPVAIDIKKQLYINTATAKQIGHSFTFEQLFTAIIIDDRDGELPTYSLEDIINRAIEYNLDIKLTKEDVAYSHQQFRKAKSQFLPSAEVALTAVQMNEGSTNELFGYAEQTYTVKGTVQQLILSEKAIAGVKTQQYMKKAQEYASQAEINKAVYDVYLAYINVLSAKSNVLIQKENLDVALQNLELAKNRVVVGASNNADVYRWESETANARQALIEAHTMLISSKLQLNNLVSNCLEDEYDLDELSNKDEIFRLLHTGSLGQAINTPGKLQTITSFLISEAKQNHPVAQQLDANQKAIDRQYKSKKRAYFMPTLSAQAQISNDFYKAGAGSEPMDPQQMPMPLPITAPSPEKWNVALNLSYSLFDRNQRQIELSESKIQKLQIAYQQEALDGNLELALKASVLELVAAKTNILHSKVAADNASKSFALIQDNYTQGLVSVSQLIDVQKSAQQAKLAHSIAVDQFIAAYIQLEYSLGFFSMLASAEERSAFEQRMQNYLYAEQ